MKNLFIIIFAMALGGCSTVSDFNSPNNPKRVLYHQWNDVDAERFKNGTFRTEYDNFIKAGEYKKASIERNRQLDAFMTGVDVYFQRNKNLLLTGRSLTDTSFDLTQLGLTGAASFAGGSTPNILAAIATALQGARISIDKNLFNDNASMLIASKMEQLRATKRVEIEKKKTDMEGVYSMDAAMRDGIEYYYAGTLNGALVAIFTETGKKQESADAELSKIADDAYKSRLQSASPPEK